MFMNKILLSLLTYANFGRIIRLISISIFNNCINRLFVKKIYAKKMLSGCKNHGDLYAIA